MRYKYLLILSILLFGTNQLKTYAFNTIKVKKGVLDLRGIDKKDLQIISFTGEFEFYWNQILEPTYFENNIINKDTIDYIKVPSKWITHKYKNKHIPSKGAATYRCIILLDSTNYHLAFRLGNIGTAYKLFINKRLIASAGIVSPIENNAKSGYNTGVFDFTTNSDTTEVIFNISNYNYISGGMWNNFYKIGLYSSISKLWNREVQFVVFLVAIMLIIAFYNIIFYFLNKKYIYTLFFGLFSLIIAVRTLIIDELFILDLFPNLNWVSLVKIEYLTLPLGNITFTLFIYNFFKDFYLKKLVNLIVIASSVSTIVIILSQPQFFTKHLVVFQTFTLLALLYTTIIVIKALRRKNIYAVIMSISFLILMGAVINDILFSNKVINTKYVSSYGFVVFILFQVYMMAMHFSSLFKKSQELTSELQTVNINLEDIVEKRTKKIEEQNEELNAQNTNIKSQKEYLEKQHEILTEQKQQITSSIEYASRIQNAVFNTTNNIKDIELDNFIFFQPKDIVSGDFYWFKNIDVNNNSLKIIAIVDCTGHGVPGAFMSILGTLLLDKTVKELPSSFEASDILNNMRSEIKKLLYEQSNKTSITDGMDMSIVIIDNNKNNIQFSGASSHIYIIRNNTPKKIEIYKGDNMPIGASVKKERIFTNYNIDIDKGDMLYMFTDGYYDQFGGEDGKRLTKNKFKSILLNISDLKISEQKEKLKTHFNNWKTDSEQIDDVTVIGIRI